MRFQVPQFVNVEDKIFGPFTLKQFIYLAGGAGMAYIFYALLHMVLPFIVSIIMVIPVVALALALAFFPRERYGKPFVEVMENALRYFVGEKLYIWKKEEKKIIPKEKKAEEALLFVPKLGESKLKDLTWNLDTKEVLNPGTKETMERKSM
ncbi:MAG: PrgI family protein [Candidatus Taylorbacteria bacterium]